MDGAVTCSVQNIDRRNPEPSSTTACMVSCYGSHSMLYATRPHLAAAMKFYMYQYGMSLFKKVHGSQHLLRNTTTAIKRYDALSCRTFCLRLDAVSSAALCKFLHSSA